MSNIVPERRRILVIDDNDAIHKDFRKTLCGNAGPSDSLASAKAALFGDAETVATVMPTFDVESAMQGQEGLKKLREALADGNPFMVAFVDMRMPPGWDGLQTIQRLWEVDPNVQVVICTAYSDYSWEEISQKLGLTDRLLILKKPFDPVEVYQIAASLSEKWALREKAHLKMEEMERIVQERTADLAHAAQHDKLTGLPNRAMLTDRLNQAFERHKRHPEYKFAVFFLDFDRFKLINDSLGHETGDELLVTISSRLEQSLRASDTLITPESSTAARLGGDEFVILADCIKDMRDIGVIAERLLQVLALPYELKGRSISSSASIGVTTTDLHYESAADMLRDADTAMYNAKAAGKARYVVFDQEMHLQVTARLAMENELRHCVERDELVLHYQPIVSLITGELECFEALLRWNHPTRGLVPPLDFIPCCEETGLIVPIGFWVLENACRQLKNWRDKYPSCAKLRMSVNLSAKQLSAPSLVQRIDRIFQETGVDGKSIILEITESMMINNADATIPILNDLRALGVGLEMDDFGTGYSSLSSLHRLPLGGIKIDRSFIQGIAERRDYAAVIQGIITMARNLGMSLVAEGIETSDQVAMLQAMDCEKAQGFFFSKPMDSVTAEAYIQNLSEEKMDAVPARLAG